MAEVVKAGELDPLSQIIMTALGWVLYMTRQYDRAIVQFRKTLKDHPGFWLTRGELGMAYVRKEMYQEAIAECVQAVEISGGLPLMVATLARVRALSGDRERALRAVEELREVSKQRYVMPHVIALIYAGLGQEEQALEWLEKGFEERGNLLCYLSVDPAFDSLRSLPRFKDLLRRIGFPS